jgi:hypothetical protein
MDILEVTVIRPLYFEDEKIIVELIKRLTDNKILLPQILSGKVSIKSYSFYRITCSINFFKWKYNAN